MSDQTIWICFEPINYPVPRILHGRSDPNGDKDVYVAYVPAARIEQLERDRDEIDALAHKYMDRFEQSEAKLAKAVEALHEIAGSSPEAEPWYIALAALAELEKQ